MIEVKVILAEAKKKTYLERLVRCPNFGKWAQPVIKVKAMTQTKEHY